MMNAEQLTKIVRKVEEEASYKFDMDEVADILAYTRRKCEVNGKGESYVPILFENELSDYIARKCINLIGYINRMKKQEAIANV